MEIHRDISHAPYSPIDAAWGLLERFDGELSAIRTNLSIADSRLQELGRARILSGSERDEQARLSDDVTVAYSRQVELSAMIHTLMEGIEQFETGVSADDDIAKLLDTLSPPNVEEDQPVDQLSKRKQAIRAENLSRAQQMGIDVDSWEFRYTFGHNGTRVVFDDPELRTDPRRIASGRSASRLVARSALDSFDAEDAFMQATADTHGGKNRDHGKNGRYYTGKNGRRIRKK